VSKDEIGNVLKYNGMDNLNLFLTEFKACTGRRGHG